MSGADTARRRDVQRRVGGAETAAPKWPSPMDCILLFEPSIAYYLIYCPTRYFGARDIAPCVIVK